MLIYDDVSKKSYAVFNSFFCLLTFWKFLSNLACAASLKSINSSSLPKIYVVGNRVNQHGVKSVKIRSLSWSVFSRFLTEYGEIQSIPLYSVWMQKNMDQKKLCVWTLFTQCSHLIYWTTSHFLNIAFYTPFYISYSKWYKTFLF